MIKAMERRRSKRIPINANIQIQIDDLMLEVPACDVSLHGISLSSDQRVDLAEGDLIALILSDSLKLPAMVVRLTEDRLHLAFTDGNLENVRAFVEVLGDGPLTLE